MEQSPSWEASCFLASQETPCILWNPQVHYCSHKAVPGIHILSQMNPFWTLPSYRGASKSLAWPGRKQANVSVRMVWISFGALPCRGGDLMTLRISVLLKSRVSLTCFRACFLPGRAKDLSAPRYFFKVHLNISLPSVPRYLKWFLSFRFNHQNVICVCVFFHTHHIPSSSPPRFHHPNNI